MEMVLAILALIVGLGALALVLGLRSRLDALERGERDTLRGELESQRGQAEAARAEVEGQRGQAEAVRTELQAVRGGMDSLRAEIDAVRAEVAELHAASEVLPPPPPPPLPKARTARLDDLREQLRAAHREPDEPAGSAEGAAPEA